MMPTMQALAMQPQRPQQYQGLAGLMNQMPTAFFGGGIPQQFAQQMQSRARPMQPRPQQQYMPQPQPQRMMPQQPAPPAQMAPEMQAALHTLQVGGAGALTPAQVTLLNAHKGAAQ